MRYPVILLINPKLRDRRMTLWFLYSFHCTKSDNNNKDRDRRDYTKQCKEVIAFIFPKIYEWCHY